MAWSLLIKNGTVVDGSGAPAAKGDVALEGDRIAAAGPSLTGEAARKIDAAGLMVAPGFIDIHSHSDFFYLECPSAESKLRQGVTTEVVGMCSFSPAPVHPERTALLEGMAGALGSRLKVGWTRFREYLDRLGGCGLSINVVHFVGHGALRLGPWDLTTVRRRPRSSGAWSGSCTKPWMPAPSAFRRAWSTRRASMRGPTS
jgi:N-acyl-D-aspartate/D-glutamate deacylase